jgi:molecular chaperone GrpE (heat shock protein)
MSSMKPINNLFAITFSVLILSSLTVMTGCAEKVNDSAAVSAVSSEKASVVDNSKAKASQPLPSESIKTSQKEEKDGSSATGVIILIAFLVILNVLMLLALLMILKWRRTVSDGMEAIVPNNLMDSLNKFSGNQISLAKWLESNISKINLDLAKQSEVVSILKKELAIKEDELSKFKQLNLTRDSEILVSKVVKLHSNLSKLSSQIDSGLITQNGAIIFLKDELADVFEELGISQISPAIGLPVKDLPSEGFTIKSTVPVSDQNMHLTVANLVESGYIFTSNGHTKVIRPAIITVNKFGE